MSEKIIPDESEPCSKTEVDIFDLPPTQVALQYGKHIELNPREFSDNHSLKFEYTADNGTYLDLSKSFFTFNVKIKGSSAQANKVGPVNNWAHSLFEQIDLEINDKLVSYSNKCYPYEAFLTTLLSYGRDAKQSHLNLALYAKDEAGKMDHADPSLDDCQKGLKERAQGLNTGETIQLLMRPFLAMFQQERLLPSGTKIGVTLIPSKAEFALMAADIDANFKPELSHMRFYARQVTLLPSLNVELTQKRMTQTAKYPLRRLKTLPKTIPKSSQTFEEDIFSGQLPRRVFVALVSEKARAGSFKLNPFHFQHYDMTEIYLTVEGVNVPAQPLKPNFDNGCYAPAYFTLFSNMGNMFDDRGLDISYKDYKNGYTIFAFDLTADMEDGDHLELFRRGIVRLSLKFKEALGEVVTIMAIAEFENTLEIDQDGNILKNFSS